MKKEETEILKDSIDNIPYSTRHEVITESRRMTWWKLLIIVIFCIAIILLFNTFFVIKTETVLGADRFGTGAFDIYGEYPPMIILHSECVRAEIFYPSYEGKKIWIEGDNNKHNGRGYCYIIYTHEVNRIKLR